MHSDLMAISTTWVTLLWNMTYLCYKWLSACLRATNSAKNWRNSSEQVPGLKEHPVQRQKWQENTWTFVLIESYDRKSPVRHANVTETRVIEVGNLGPLSIPDPKRILVFACFALSPSQHSREILSASPDYRSLCFKSKRMGTERLKRYVVIGDNYIFLD